MTTSIDLNPTENVFLIYGRLQIVLNIETGDPDDFITFIFLLGHSMVHLKAVTVVPDASDQIDF
jgi:hypothetical protein